MAWDAVQSREDGMHVYVCMYVFMTTAKCFYVCILCNLKAFKYACGNLSALIHGADEQHGGSVGVVPAKKGTQWARLSTAGGIGTALPPDCVIGQGIRGTGARCSVCMGMRIHTG